MLEDDIGNSGAGCGCHGRVVITPQEPGFPVEPESLDTAVDGTTMIAATTLTSLELRLLGGTDVSAPVMKSSSSALGANAFQDTDVALAPLRDAPHQSNNPTIPRKDAGLLAPDLP